MARLSRDTGLALLLGLLCTLILPAGSGHAAEIVSIEGTGQFRPPQQSDWSPARVKQTLKPLEFVRTGDLSKMALLFPDRTQIRLAPNSVLQIKEAASEKGGRTVVDLNRGRTWMQSKTAPGGFAVQTPGAVASIRGTDWEIEVAPDGTSILTVLSGEVEFANALGTVRVERNEQAVAQPGRAPTKLRLNNSRSRVQWVTAIAVPARQYLDASLTPSGRQPVETAVGMIENGRHEDAAKVLRAALSVTETNTRNARLLLIEILIWAGRRDEAREGLESLREGAASRDIRADLILARLAMQEDRWDEARALLAGALGRKSDDLEAQLLLGELKRLDGDPAGAGDAYLAAAALMPTDPRSSLGLGLLAADRGDLDLADQHFARGLLLARRDPQHAQQALTLQAEIGALALLRNEPSRATVAFAAVLQNAPDNYLAWTGLGIAALKRGDHEAALYALARATALEPRYARALLYQAVAYYRSGRVDRARETLALVTERDFRDPLPHVLGALIGQDEINPDQALAEAMKALEKLPYLKSLSPVASTQAGNANLGSALVQYGLEGWSRHMAQASAQPFWAPSHLFQAERLAGPFSRRSALMQGFIVDPLVFGASNLRQSLVEQPGQYGAIGLRLGHSDDQSLREPLVTANGRFQLDADASGPVAWFAEAIDTRIRGRNQPLDADARTLTVGLGMRPRWNVGLFLYANQIDADILAGMRDTSGLVQAVDGRNRRLELGGNWAPDAASQWWWKLGRGKESSSVAEASQIVLPGLNLARTSDFVTRPDSEDAQLRYTRIFAKSWQLVGGVEYAQTDTRNDLAQDVTFAAPGSSVARNRLDARDTDRSRLVRLMLGHASTDWQIEAGLGHQRYLKDRAFVATLAVPAITQRIDDDQQRSRALWSLGFQRKLAHGAILRAACEDWVRPASPSSLLPIAIAGIIFDDQLIYAGGRSERCRVQLDWPVSHRSFIGIALQEQRVANLFSTLDGVLNTRADVTNLDRLRNRNLPLPPKPDALEESPVFSLGTHRSGNLNVGHLLAPALAAQIDYSYSDSRNTGPAFPGTRIPYLPRHRLSLSATLSRPGWAQFSATATYRSERFADEANLQRLAADWDLQLRSFMEFDRKRWTIEVFATNLLRKGASDSGGLIATYRF